MNETRRQILRSIAEGPRTGPELADQLELSRAGIWKHVESLRGVGFDIESGPDGYELQDVPEYGAETVEFGLEAPYSVQYHETVESTNDVARDLANEGGSEVVVLADEQTGGRGRQNRAWRSPAGGIWLSILLRPSLPPARVPLLTLGAAVAVVRAVDNVGVSATIKWPNDVLVETGTGTEAKLAGILTEMTGESAQVSWVVIGVGLNANVDQDAVGAGATSLRELVGDIDRRSLVQDILETFHDLATNPESIIPAWTDHASTLGRRVKVDTGTETVQGTARRVTDVGALVIETGSDSRTVHAGDCEHLRPLDSG